MARNFSDKTFTKILRGYSPEEVKEYIAYIDGEYRKLERISSDNVRKLALALRKLDEMNNYAEQLEKQIEEQSAIVEKGAQAQIDYDELARIKAEIEEKANQDADAVLSEARTQGEKIVSEAEELGRSVRDKIITEAAAKAEAIIREAQARTEETRRSAETMGAAALRMYSEVLSFRDTLFEAYNTHIESIEEIIETADELFGDEEENDGDDNAAEESADQPEQEMPEDDYDGELLAAVDISEYGDMLESLEEEAEELEMDISDFREIIDEMPISESADALTDEFVVVGVDDVEYSDEDGECSDGEINSIDEAEPADDEAEEWISAEAWDMENSGEIAQDYSEAAAEYAVYAAEDDDLTDEAVEPLHEDEAYEDEAYEDEFSSADTYESYGEPMDEEKDEIDPIELEAQKYSDVYPLDTDDEDFYTEQPTDEELYPDFENAEYAPSPEYAWGDDMFVEPETEDDGYASDEVAADAEVDELDRLKEFFSASFDESAARRRDYDVGSNSTTSIALSLNDFFEDGEGNDDYVGGDMDSLFERSGDMSVTDEFDIVFGKMDSAKSVAEIRRQPIIPPEKPEKHKKHKKF